MYLVDTNVMSELRKAHKAHIAVQRWADELDPEKAYISVISILELERGTSLLERRDPRQGARLRRWLANGVLSRFSGRVLPVTLEIAISCGRLHVPNPRPERDTLIAATALVHGLCLVTRNTKDFVIEGLRVVNPWDDDAAPHP